MNSDKFKRQIESMWKYRDTDEQKRLVKFTIAKTMRLALEYPELAQEYFDSLCKVIPDNERITVSNYQHNLTSDAVEEEMLTCEKSKAMQLYSHLLDLVENERISEHYSEWCDLEREYIALFEENVFADYFGSKYLPDEDVHEDNFTRTEPKPSEPKFNLGDKAILKGYVCTITSIVYEQGKFVGYKIESPLLHGIATVPESDLEPYTEPVGTKDDTKGNTKDPTFTDDCKSQCKSPDRLRIAAMAMEGILSKGELAGPDEVTDMALIYADELIKKCEEGSTL